MKKLSVALTLGCLAVIFGCGPVSTDSNSSSSSAGEFTVVSVNILEGEAWSINRPIQIKFNHAIDFNSVSFQSVAFRAVEATGSSPVTGQFELDSSDSSVLIFNPACPTNPAQDNGAFVPGGVEYVLEIPTSDETISVLRDSNGRPLSFGLRRGFTTPAVIQPFIDLVPGAPIVLNAATDIHFPDGVNFWADSDGAIGVRFNQSIDARDTNLNTNNLLVLYSNGEIGSGQENDFDSTNNVPGEWVLIENCSSEGALVEFHITGVLPVNRNIKLQTTIQFADIVGQRNFETKTLAVHQVPSLSAVYASNTGSWVDANETVDEFRDGFDDQSYLDLAEPLPVPLANINDGFISASFDYPGTYVSEDKNFHIDNESPRELYTDSALNFADSDSQVHVIQSGVLNVHDFTIDAGAVLRGRGNNPLVIYATGTVTINGELNVSGNNAVWPSGLNSPQFIEGGALGSCGGGQGGDASQIGTAETPRAETGDGPFGIASIGGQGGEGIFNGRTGSTGITGQNARSAAGGGGGGFALTENQSVLWATWKTAGNWAPSYFTDPGPDHDTARHSMAVGVNGIFGSEAGMRGVSASSILPNGNGVGIPHGMEDGLIDSFVFETISTTNAADYDPPWNSGAIPPFNFGHPTEGADAGVGGPPVFLRDNDLLDDFYGSRLMVGGTIKQGELLAPWAGSGGGGSGDSMMIAVWDADGDGTPDPVESFYPVVPFARNFSSTGNGWYYYQKGAGGGGGGGQLIIMSIGMIVIGDNAEIKANGGIGYSGESLTYTDQGVSGSGGGSGGHIILHSSTGVDFSNVNIGIASSAATIGNLTDNGVVQAFGGRRGQCGGEWDSGSTRGGTGTYAFGRGGAGANGVIQIHVPNPKEDIIWHPSAAPGIADYLDLVTVPTDRIEEILGHVSFPQSYSLVPFYSASSMVTSEWIDTGLAELRLQSPNLYPKWDADVVTLPELVAFRGIFPTDGEIARQGQQEKVRQLDPIVGGSVNIVDFQINEMAVPNVSVVFAIQSQFLRLPELLIGYDIRPNAASDQSFEIVDVVYDNANDSMTLYTANGDGAMTFSVVANGNWSIIPKFFRIDAGGVKNKLPNSADIYFEFQGADEIAAGVNEPGTPLLGNGVWTSDLSLLAGTRFVRYRIRFEADSQSTGISLSTSLPSISYVKIPYVF
ncbi:MAG: hypothetical protein ACI84O_000239 [Myxococcota bacterium]|jgi:hypothetical protein